MTLCNVYATAFACFECVLVGAIVCGIQAARHVPAPDADYILILGCKFRRDGTLTPLLRGRVDRAVAFWKRQRELTGKEAVLMPSGGQGADEPIAEAEAMRRYIAAQGIPGRSVLLEGLRSIPGLSCNNPTGAFYVFVDIRGFGMTSAEFCNRLLDEAKVVWIPGSAFGECGEGFARAAYTCSEEDLREAVERVRNFCEKLNK